MISLFSMQQENYAEDTSVDKIPYSSRTTLASVQITVSGNRYVFVGLTKGSIELIIGPHTHTATLYFVRDSTDIGYIPLEAYSGGVASAVGWPNFGSLFVFDRPAKGTYTYKLEGNIAVTAGVGTPDSVIYSSPSFIAKEFIF